MPLSDLRVKTVAEEINHIIRRERRRMKKQINEAIKIMIPHQVNRLSVSDWAEKKRILPQGLSPMPGPFTWKVTPYLREIADCFSENSPIQKTAIMKGTQLGFTVGIGENWMGYVIDVAPGPMMFVSGDKEMAQDAVEVRVDRMIESAGLADKIFSQTDKPHSKKTGDTKRKKEFPGGFLLALGPNVGAKLRQFSVRYLFYDEVDAYPQETGTEGDPLKLGERRTDAFERIRKILYISTPLVEQTSRIKPLFERGDQRYYYVPCRHCHHKQVIKWDRLKYEKDEFGRLIWNSVHYECERCYGHWKNEDKAYFLPRGEWRPTAEPMEPGFRSYHLSALYSPVGMRSWESICQEWIQVKEDPVMLRVFVNTVLGETWVERGEAPRYERIMLRREQYQVGILPEKAKPLLLTIGADVQKDRIEVEIVAWGKDKESWSVDYRVLSGDTAHVDDPCWQKLRELITAKHAGLPPAMVLIDAGYNTPTVYAFCEVYLRGVFPVMGDSAISRHQKAFLLRDVQGYQTTRVDLNTDFLKLELYGYLAKGMPEDAETYPGGYCHFPQEYGEKYFRQLTAEERMKKTTSTGTFRYVWHLASGRRNEALDARVYAMGALYVLRQFASEDLELEEEMAWSEFWNRCEKILK